MKVFIFGDVYELKDEASAVDKFKKIYGQVWRKDVLNWALALLLREGKIAFIVDGRDATSMALEAIENTMRLLGIDWSDLAVVTGQVSET